MNLQKSSRHAGKIDIPVLRCIGIVVARPVQTLFTLHEVVGCDITNLILVQAVQITFGKRRGALELANGGINATQKQISAEEVVSGIVEATTSTVALYAFLDAVNEGSSLGVD